MHYLRLLDHHVEVCCHDLHKFLHQKVDSVNLLIDVRDAVFELHSDRVLVLLLFRAADEPRL